MADFRIAPLFQIEPLQLRALLQSLLEEVPPLEYGGPFTDVELRWLSRAEALVEASGSNVDTLTLKRARDSLKTYSHSHAAIMGPIYNAYYRAELHCPVEAQGRFIAPQDTWNGYAALVRLFQKGCGTLFIVDPYVDATMFTELLPHAKASTKINCLTSKTSNHAGLLAAYEKWQVSAPAGIAPVEVRYAPERTLHDRLIFVDGEEVWLISQSFKDIAKRSPASLALADEELSAAKTDHYGELWKQSVPLA